MVTKNNPLHTFYFKMPMAVVLKLLCPQSKIVNHAGLVTWTAPRPSQSSLLYQFGIRNSLESSHGPNTWSNPRYENRGAGCGL